MGVSDEARGAFGAGVLSPVIFETPQRLTDFRDWHPHIPFAFWLVQALRPRTIVELGTFRGDSYCAFAQAVNHLRLPCACFAIDTWRGDEQTGYYGEEVYEELQQYHDQRYAHFSRLIRSTFDDALDSFADGSIDLLHIDGLHTYAAAEHDFETWRRKLSARAVVLIHHINSEVSPFGISRLWKYLLRDHHSFNFDHGYGLGVLLFGSDSEESLKRLATSDEAEAAQIRLVFARLGSVIAMQSEAAARLTKLDSDEAEMLQARAHAEAGALQLRREIDSLWNSASWKLFRPLRNLIRSARRQGKENPPGALSDGEAIQTLVTIRQSLSWELTAPLRLAHRVLQAARPRHKSAASPTPVGEPATGPFAESWNWDELQSTGAFIQQRGDQTGEPAAPVKFSSKPKILFVSHEASRTGAPLILLNLMRHFAQEERYELFVFCDRAGALLEDFSRYGHVINRGLHDVFARTPRIEDMLLEFRDSVRLAICNTAMVVRYSKAFKQFDIPVITLVHELADRFDKSQFQAIHAVSDRVVFPAEFVCNSAKTKVPILEDKAVTIPQGLLNPDLATSDRAEARRSVCRQLGIRQDTFLVLGCGTMEMRKGFDLFVSLAQRVLGDNKLNICFLWVGPNPKDHLLLHFARKDIAELKIGDRVRLLGESDAPARFFLASDVFVLTSREDPFPCVVHEAMAAGTPVIAFEGGGGAPEALADGAGIVVGYRDVDAMGAAILQLRDDPERAAAIARTAIARVLTKYRFEDYYRSIVRLARDELHVDLDLECNESAPDTAASHEVAGSNLFDGTGASSK